MGRMPWTAWIKVASPSAATAAPSRMMCPDERTTGWKRLKENECARERMDA